MSKSKYREKQERGLVPSRYPSQMKGAWQNWPRDVRSGKDMAMAGKHDVRPRPPEQQFTEPYRPVLNFYLEARRQGDERR